MSSQLSTIGSTTAGVSFVGTSNTIAATLIQLGACGIMSQLLSGMPEISFWRFRYSQYSDFAMDSILFQFNSQVQFGNTATAPIQRLADLAYFIYLVVKIPGIVACPPGATNCGPVNQFPSSINPGNPCAANEAAFFSVVSYEDWLYNNYRSCGSAPAPCPAAGAVEPEPFAYWVNAIGYRLVKKATLNLGNFPTENLYADFLYMWEELTAQPGKQPLEMIGKRYCIEDLVADSSSERILYVPLPFTCTMSPGTALPLAALYFSGASIQVEFEQLRKCIVQSRPGVAVQKCGGGAVTDNDIQAILDVTLITLTTEERDRFTMFNFEQLIYEVQNPMYQSLCCASASIQLQFFRNVVELIWGIRRKCQLDANNWTNWSGIDNRDPAQTFEITFAGSQRVYREAQYFRLVQPYQWHTNIPDSMIYNYSFALYPEEVQPSGSANFTRIQPVYLNVVLQVGLATEVVEIAIYARSIQFVRYRQGGGGKVFQ